MFVTAIRHPHLLDQSEREAMFDNLADVRSAGVGGFVTLILVSALLFGVPSHWPAEVYTIATVTAGVVFGAAAMVFHLARVTRDRHCQWVSKIWMGISLSCAVILSGTSIAIQPETFSLGA